MEDLFVILVICHPYRYKLYDRRKDEVLVIAVSLVLRTGPGTQWVLDEYLLNEKMYAQQLHRPLGISLKI